MANNKMVLDAAGETVINVLTGSEYCDYHKGYHPLIVIGGDALVDERFYATEREANIVAHNQVIEGARQEGDIVLPWRFDHILQDRNAANN